MAKLDVRAESMSRIKFLVFAGVVIGLVMLFIFWPGAKAPVVVAEPPQITPVSQAKILVAELPPAGQPGEHVSAMAKDRLTTLMEEKKNGKDVFVPVVNFVGKVDEKFAELFDLTEADVGRVQKAIDAALGELGELEFENAAIIERGDRKITVRIKAFPESGGRLYDKLTNEIGDILGPEKKQSFVALATQSLDEGLGFFGMADKTATLKWKADIKFYTVKESTEIRETADGRTSVAKRRLSMTFSDTLLAKTRPALAEIVNTERASSAK